MKTAVVAGASGLIGKELVQKLINSDHYRRIYVLSRKKSGLVNNKIVELVIDFEKMDQLKFDEPVDDVFCTLGANSKSAVFYNKVKGMTEERLISIGVNQLVIFRPSLLLGDRPEKRFAERLSGFFMIAFNFLIPDNYKAIQAEKVADCMLKMALKSTEKVLIVKSGEMLRHKL